MTQICTDKKNVRFMDIIEHALSKTDYEPIWITEAP